MHGNNALLGGHFAPPSPPLQTRYERIAALYDQKAHSINSEVLRERCASERETAWYGFDHFWDPEPRLELRLRLKRE